MVDEVIEKEKAVKLDTCYSYELRSNPYYTMQQICASIAPKDGVPSVEE